MKNNGLFLIVIIAMFMQNFMSFERLADRYTNKFPTPFIFLLGVEPKTEYIVFMMWYFVFVSISFNFLGEFAESVNGYGKYVLIRNYNKKKWILQKFLFISAKLFGFVVIQSFISILTKLILQTYEGSFLVNNVTLKIFLIYYLGLLTLILIQMYLELHVSPQIALIIVNVYVVFSILLASFLFLFEKGQWLLYGLLPNFTMGLRLDILSDNAFNIYYSEAIFMLLIIIIGIILVSIKSIKVKDLY